MLMYNVHYDEIYFLNTLFFKFYLVDTYYYIIIRLGIYNF